MASKLQTVVAFLHTLTESMSRRQGQWQAYLQTAAQVYKYSFHDQVLIYGQRPQATACATLELWNQRMGRWINRGASGIALLDDSGPRLRLRYVFDVADTSPGRNRAIEPRLWHMTTAHEAAVLESLSNSYGPPSYGAAPFVVQVQEICANVTDDNFGDYLEQLQQAKQDSFLEELDELNLRTRFRELVSNSIAYTVLTRCGYDADQFYQPDDFAAIHDFSTYEVMTILGNATSTLSKMMLMDIGRTITSLERSAEFAKLPDMVYDGRENNTPPAERKERDTHGRTDVHEDRGLLLSGSGSPAGGRRSTAPGQIRDAAQDVSEGAPPAPVRADADDLQAVPVSAGDRPAGPRDGGSDRPAHGGSRGRERGDESQRSDALGGPDEQLQGIGGGDRSAPTGLRITDPEPGDAQLGFFEQLDTFPQAEYVEPTSSAFFVAKKQLDVVLTLGGNDPHLRMMVALEYMKGKSTAEIAKRLPTLYRGSNGFNLDGAEISVWFDEQCIHIARGKTARFAPSRQVIAWETAAERIGQLLENGQFATNVELAEAPGYERNLLAQQLWYLYHDFSSAAIDAGYLPSLAENPARGYPAETAWLAAQLDIPEFRQSLAEEYTAFQAAYRENRNLLRFHHHKLQEISDGLHTLSLPRVAFSSALTEIPTPQQFITQDEIDTAMSRGSGFAGGKVRIFAFFQENHTEKEKAAFLKHEYGLGGHSHALSGAAGSSEDHNSKGMLYQKDGCPEVRFPWEAVSKRITELIRQDRYLTREEQAEYDKIQAEKALGEEAIATSIAHVQTDLPSPESAEPLPVGRIDFLGTNGDVGESVEYTDAEKFVAAIKEENYFGVPMRIVLYRDSAGHTIPQDFLKELDPPPQGFEITDTAIRQAEPPDTEKVAEYLSDQERIAVFRYPNGKFYNHYGYHEQIEVPSTVAGGFDTFEEAQATVYAHRPKAEKVLEPAEKAVDMARDTDSAADRRIPDREVAPALSTPRPRAKVSSTILHPEQTNRHDHRITDDALGVGTPSERYQNNIAAIRLLKQLEREDRLATPEEQEILSRYVGWGGLADCFEETNRNYLELKNLLTPEEYAAVRESTLTAFYTPPVVIRSMYQALEQMGFETGNILEPSCGTGNFLGMIPERMSSSKRYGIELDEISGQIARQLYQTASVTINGYEKTNLPDSFFDVAIGNIPFGNFKVADRRYNKHNFLIHDYFFGKTLDKEVDPHEYRRRGR